MRSRHKKVMQRITIILIAIILPNPLLAICPLCTIAVGSGMGLFNWIGVDDIIVGIWFGAWIVSMILWTLSWMNRKQIYFKGRTLWVILFCSISFIVPMYLIDHVVAQSSKNLLGMDSKWIGVLLGSFLFMLGYKMHIQLKKKKKGVYFPFQKVILPLVPLGFATVLLNFFKNF